jgi:hypothetical protein
MKRKHVRSRSIRSVGYDSERKTLELKFQPGGVYQYFGVPRSVYQRLLKAPSIGRFVNEKIKENYPFQLIEEAPTQW